MKRLLYNLLPLFLIGVCFAASAAEVMPMRGKGKTQSSAKLKTSRLKSTKASFASLEKELGNHQFSEVYTADELLRDIEWAHNVSLNIVCPLYDATHTPNKFLAIDWVEDKFSDYLGKKKIYTESNVGIGGRAVIEYHYALYRLLNMMHENMHLQSASGIDCKHYLDYLLALQHLRNKYIWRYIAWTTQLSGGGSYHGYQDPIDAAEITNALTKMLACEYNFLNNNSGSNDYFISVGPLETLRDRTFARFDYSKLDPEFALITPSDLNQYVIECKHYWDNMIDKRNNWISVVGGNATPEVKTYPSQLLNDWKNMVEE